MESAKTFKASFVMLTEEKLRQWWKLKEISARRYLECILEILRPPGKPLIIPSVTVFCDDWAIAPSTFYKAVSQLKAAGRMDWRATEGVVLWKPRSSTVVFSRSTDVDEDSTDVDECSSKPAHSKGSSAPLDQYSDQYQIGIERERESGQNFEKSASLPPEPTLVSVSQAGAIEEARSAPAKKPRSSFDAARYAWSAAEIDELERLAPEFWAWMISRTRSYSDRRVLLGKKAVDHIDLYALEKARNDGLNFYREWESVGQQKPSAQAEWQKTGAALDAHYQRGDRPVLLAALSAHMAGGSGYPPDPQKVEWLVGHYPHWQVRIENGALVDGESAQVDLSEVQAQIQVRVRELDWSAQQVSDVLHENFGVRARSQLKDGQLVELLQILLEAKKKDRPAQAV